MKSKNGKVIKIGDHNFKEILSPKLLESKIHEIAKKISVDYSNSNSLVLLIVTNGGMYFGTALSMALQDLGFSHYVDTVRIKRYTGDGESTSEVKVSSKPSLKLSGKDVIVVEDLIDEGLTMNFLDNYLKTTEGMMPKSIEYCVLVEKKDHVKLSFGIKYFILDEAGPEWLVGFGMDSNFGYRGLRGIYAKID
jgi:hypoxanthine phosphoribosyltransferase